jgi:hypothetical protein
MKQSTHGQEIRATCHIRAEQAFLGGTKIGRNMAEFKFSMGITTCSQGSRIQNDKEIRDKRAKYR